VDMFSTTDDQLLLVTRDIGKLVARQLITGAVKDIHGFLPYLQDRYRKGCTTVLRWSRRRKKRKGGDPETRRHRLRHLPRYPTVDGPVFAEDIPFVPHWQDFQPGKTIMDMHLDRRHVL
jgi:hypothetical protein